MPKVTQLPKSITISDSGVFVIVDSGKARQISWKALRESNLRGDTGFTGSASNQIGYTGSTALGYFGSVGFTGSASTQIGYTGSGGIGYSGSLGYSGSEGYYGSVGYYGSIGYTGSAGPSSTPLTLIKTTTTNYVPTTTDHGYYIRMNNATSATITLVSDSTEVIPIGTTYIIGQVNTGTVSFVAEGVANVYSPNSSTISVQWGKVTVIKTAENTWEIDGAI